MLSKCSARIACVLLYLAISTVTKSQQLTADFSAASASGCAPLIVNFKDASSGNVTQWYWDLGNGTISFLKDPSATYLTPGKYTVKLVVTDANTGTDSVVKTEFIHVFGQPTVQFNS
ncbi:MAG TPA: PKD domain-containing protein, partial [Ferruginibacter sp.]|nr:PKD domain-containing protein [Ferruginibacter sp.]